MEVSTAMEVPDLVREGDLARVFLGLDPPDADGMILLGSGAFRRRRAVGVSMDRTGRTPFPRRRGTRQPGRLLLLTLTGALAVLGGCASWGRLAVQTPQGASLTYVIPKDPHLLNLRGLRFVKLPLPPHAPVEDNSPGEGIATSFLSDGIILVDRFNLAPLEKGRRSGVEYRVQQEVIDTGDGYAVTLRPVGVRTYGGTFFFGPPLPNFAEEDLLRHLASAVFTYAIEVESIRDLDLLSARILRQAEPAPIPPDERDSATESRRMFWFSMSHQEVQIVFGFEAAPSAGNGHVTLYVKVPSQCTSPRRVDVARILSGLKERLMRIISDEVGSPPVLARTDKAV
jgi:hypothetical protein